MLGIRLKPLVDFLPKPRISRTTCRHFAEENLKGAGERVGGLLVGLGKSLRADPQIKIFNLIDDKDVFQKFYSKFLARRLIQGLSISDDAEGFMISGLKAASGFEYTSKLQRMFTDMALSVDLNEKFKDYAGENGVKLGIEFNIRVLTGTETGAET